MGRYLNSQTREDTVVICGIIGRFRKITENWSKMKNPPKEVIEYLKAANRFTSRALRELDKDLDNQEVARIRRVAATTKFELSYVPHGFTAKTPEKITYDITEDERDAIVEALAQVNCIHCNGCVKDCTIRKQFFKWDVDPVHTVTDDKHPCQYMMPD